MRDRFPGHPGSKDRRPHSSHFFLADIEDRFPWFPFGSVLDSSDLLPISSPRLLEPLLTSSGIVLGRPPDCDVEDTDTACFTKSGVGQFKLIIFPNDVIRLYVAKLSSYHDENYFAVEAGKCSDEKSGEAVLEGAKGEFVRRKAKKGR